MSLSSPPKLSERPSRRDAAALQTLYDVGRALASTLDYEAVLEKVMALSMDAVGSETASVMLADEATGDLVLVCSRGLPKEVKAGARLPSRGGIAPSGGGTASSGGGIAEWVYRHGEPVVLHGSPADDPRFHVAESRGHIRSALSVPLVGKHGPIGVLSLNNSRRGRAFTPGDLDLLTAIGTQAGIAVENARLHRRLEETNHHLTVTVEHLRNLKSSLTSMTAPSLDDALGTMLDAAVEGTSASAGSLTVLDEGDATHQIETCSYGSGLFLPDGAEGADYADAAKVIEAASRDLRHVAERPSHSMLRVLTAEGKVIGLLKLVAPADGPGFNPDDQEFVDALVDHASIVVLNSMLYQEAETGREALAKAYAELQEKQDQLIQSEKLAAIGQLAAKICHEINNPLTAISGCAQLIQRKLGADASSPNAEVVMRYLETIASETERCTRITGDLLQFARKQEPRFLEFDLHNTIANAISLLEYQYPSSLEVLADFDFELPRIVADPQQLTQVLLNLLNNAAQAMPEGGRIDVSTRRLWSDDGALCVQVDIRDTGTGISEEAAAHLFSPFYTTKANGTGLGLIISKGIMEKHRGSLSLRTAEGGGTVATMILPLDARPLTRQPADVDEAEG